GGDEVVIDDLWRGAGLVGADVAFHAGVGALRNVFRVDEAGSVAVERGAVVRMQPLLGLSVARFAVYAEGVVAAILTRVGRRCRVATEAALMKSGEMFLIRQRRRFHFVICTPTE